jgi:hypothetical protein
MRHTPPLSSKSSRGEAAKIVALLLPLPFYCLLSLCFFGPKHWSDLTQSLFTPSGDPESFVWSLNWWPFALAHHLNPFVTKYIWYPAGFNLAWATSIPAIALLMSPITLLFGANTSFNLLALLAPPLSAASCFYLVYVITRKYFPALAAGYIYGFSSYELGQLLGHTNLDVTFLIPLAVLVVLMRIQGKLRRAPYVALLALIAILQFGTSIEVFTTFSLFGFLALVIFYFSSAPDLRKRIIMTFYESLGGLGVAFVFLAPYLYYLLRGYSSVPKILNSATIFSADVFNYVVATPLTQIGVMAANIIPGRYTGNISENGTFLGLPLILILCHYIVTRWRKSYTAALTIILVIILISSLGSRLHINGVITAVRLPWAIAVHLPILRNVLPTRLTLYVSLVAAVMVGLWLASESPRRTLIVKYAAVLLAIICIVPSPAQYNWTRINVPPIFAKGTTGKYIKKNENVVILPYGSNGSSMYYQYASGMQFTQSGGYVGFTPPQFSSAFAWPSKTFAKNLALFCKDNHVAAIIYTPQTPRYLVHSLRSLGWPTVAEGGAKVITVPKQ